MKAVALQIGGQHGGHVGIILLVAGLLVGAAIALGFIANEWAQPLILGLLALLSVVGVFCLFAFAIGLIQFAGRSARNDLTKAIADSAEAGVVDAEGLGDRCASTAVPDPFDLLGAQDRPADDDEPVRVEVGTPGQRIDE